MPIDTILNFISVVIAAIDIGIVIYDRLDANKQSNKPSQSDRLTVNIFIQNNLTAHSQNLQAGTVYTMDHSSYGNAFFTLIIIIGLFLQKYFRVFIILLSISTLLALSEAKWASHTIYVPLSNAKRLIWFVSPSVILISSLTVNLLLDFVTFSKYFGNITELLLSWLVYGFLGVAFLLLFVQQFFTLLIQHLHGSSTISYYIKAFAATLFKAWCLPIICAPLAVMSLLPSLLVM